MWRSWLCGLWPVRRCTNQPASVPSASFTDLDQDAAILNDLLTEDEPLLPRLQLRLLHRVHLEQPVEMHLLPPTPLEVVVPDRSSLRVDDGGILPAGELNQQARRLPAIEPGNALDRFSEPQAAASLGQSGRFLDPGLDLDNVRHRVRCSFLVKGNR